MVTLGASARRSSGFAAGAIAWMLACLACTALACNSGHRQGEAAVGTVVDSGSTASAPASRPAVTTSRRRPVRSDVWEAEIRRFEQADRENPPPAGAVLFIGSSSIRIWKDLAADFSQYKVINRGFGGSCIADSTRYVDRIVAPYRPRMVVLYAGDNDVASGLTARQVFEDYKAFVREVRRAPPEVPIAFISIKPSPARRSHLPAIREANKLIHSYCEAGNKLTYIDVFTPMLTADGEPRAELFGPDKLHLNRQGYDLWKAIITPCLGKGPGG
jgi:lysophospholipase L1-like esterase